MGFDLAGMGEVAQGMSNMRDAQDRQRAAAQLAEDNAGRLRTLQQAEVDRRVQAKQYADFATKNQDIRQSGQYSNVPINPDATNLPAPAAPVGNAGLAVSYPPAAAPAAVATPAPAPAPAPAPFAMPQRPIMHTPDAPPDSLLSTAVKFAPAAGLFPGAAILPYSNIIANKLKNISDTAKIAGTPADLNQWKWGAPTTAAAAAAVANPVLPFGAWTANQSRAATLGLPSRPVNITPVPNAPDTPAATAAPAAVPPTPSALYPAVQRWAPQVSLIATQYGVDPSVALSLMQQESSGDPNAVPRDPKTGKLASSAKGLYQFIDSTAAKYNLVDKADPIANIDAGMRLMRDSLTTFNGDYAKAIAAHHDGEDKVSEAVSTYGDNWRQGLLPKTSKYVDTILARAGHPAAFAADTGEPMPSTLIPPTAPATPAAQKIVLDNRKVWNTVASSATPQEDALRENKLRFYNLRIRSSNDPAEQQALMDKIDAVTKEGDEANMFHAYMGASNGDPAGIQALAGQYNEATGTQIGITMQGDKMVVYNKGADGNPNVLQSGTPHDIASQLYTSMSPMLRAKQAEVTAEAAKAEVQEAPKRATALQTEALKATATSKDKQLSNLTRLKYAQILGDARFKASFATLGVKMNEVHLHPSQIGQPQFMDKFGQLYTYEAAKSDGKHSSAAGWVLTDMSNVTPPANYTMPQQVAGADASAAADSPSDAYPEGK